MLAYWMCRRAGPITPWGRRDKTSCRTHAAKRFNARRCGYVSCRSHPSVQARTLLHETRWTPNLHHDQSAELGARAHVDTTEAAPARVRRRNSNDACRCRRPDAGRATAVSSPKQQRQLYTNVCMCVCDSCVDYVRTLRDASSLVTDVAKRFHASANIKHWQSDADTYVCR